MNILFVYFKQIIHNDNLYIRSLYEEIQRQGYTVECDIDTFWNTRKKYDIVHIQFPEVIFKWRKASEEELKTLQQRIDWFKQQGSKIVYTRHDAIPHYCSDKNKLELFRIVETQCDAIIHLGEYSRQDFNRTYPGNKIQHFVIPHHIYDLCQYTFPSKDEAKQWLKIPAGKFVILTFGSYRDEEEQELIIKAFKLLPLPDKYLLAPGFYNDCFINRKTPIHNLLKHHIKKKKFQLDKDLALQQHGKISNTQLPYYFSAADIVLIQRKSILNSGNVPMAFFFHKPVAGPKFGNIGELLRQTGNPTFDLTDSLSVVNAISQISCPEAQELGERNAEFAHRYMGTKTITLKTISSYKQILNS